MGVGVKNTETIYKVTLDYEILGINTWIPKQITFLNNDINVINQKILEKLQDETAPIRNIEIKTKIAEGGIL